MGKKDKVQMPSGMAGLVKYGNEPKKGIKIKPEHIIAISAGIVVIEVLLKFLG